MCSTEEAGGYERLRLPCDTDWTAWHRFCFGRSTDGAVAASMHAQDGSNGAAAMAEEGSEVGEQPTLPVLLSMEPVRAFTSYRVRVTPHITPNAVHGQAKSINPWVGIRHAAAKLACGKLQRFVGHVGCTRKVEAP